MIQEVIDRLKAAAPSLAAVLPAEDIELLGKGTAPKDGTLFVLPYRERAEENPVGAGRFRQLVHVQLLTALVVRRHDDAKGGARASLFDARKEEIEKALAGWSTAPRNRLFELVAGQAAALGNGASVYVQTWQTTRYLES